MPLIRSAVAVLVAGTLGTRGVEADVPAVIVWPSDVATVESLPGGEKAVQERGFEVADYANVRESVLAGRDAELDRERSDATTIEAGLERARATYLDQNWDEMLAATQRVETSALDQLASRMCPSLWELEFRMGLAFKNRGNKGDAAKASQRFRLAVALDTDRRPPPELYGPAVQTVFAEAVDEASGQAPRSTRLVVDPPDARVLVDCEPVSSEAPLPLAPGLHVVRVSAPGYRTQSRVFEVSGDALEVGLQPAGGPASAALGFALAEGDLDYDAQSTRAVLLEVADEAGANALVLVSPQASGGHTAQGFAGTERTRKHNDRDLAVAVALVLAEFSDDGDVRLGRPEVIGPVGTVRIDRAGRGVLKPWHKAVIALSVIAAAGLAIGLGLGLGLRNDPDRLHIIVD